MQVKKRPQDVSVRYIKGVGPKKADLFEKIGVHSIADLFYYLPRRYEDRSRIVKVRELRPGGVQTVVGEVLKTNIFTAKTGTCIFEAAIGDETSRVFAVWYNQPYMNKVLSPGQTVMLYGDVELQKRLVITHPAFAILDNVDIAESLEVGRIVPIYSLTEKLTQRYLRKTVHQAIQSYVSGAEDCLPTALRARHKLVDSEFAIQNIHFPRSFENLERAYNRLVFEEFFILQVVMALRRKKFAEDGIGHELGDGLLDDFRDLFPFELTEGQKKCIHQIERDMLADRPMYRLLQGDVGSGKTVVAMYALLLTAKNGYQGTMMAPTEILARQHYVTLSKTFMPLGLSVRLLVNGISRRDHDMIVGEIHKGEVDIVVGTHSLIQEKIDYKNLGLVIIDEQHKFGVAQRKELRGKGKIIPDTLVMTATPIPRSLALTVYGDMDLSLMKEKPGGRLGVTTYCVTEEKRQLVYDFIRGEIENGRQAFIVYPRIKKTASSDLLAAEEMYKQFKGEVFKDLRVVLVHGRMKSPEKDKIMTEFRDKKFDILIATTIIEVGVDIPNVTVMMVEHAERYGLAQLHQLRGRIGRGKYASYCILMGDPKTDASRERLSVMTETDDGFKIAEKDLDLRGPGEFLGTRQSGLPELKFGNIIRDFAIMEKARNEAFERIHKDPSLKDPRNGGLRRAIMERFGGKVSL